MATVNEEKWLDLSHHNDIDSWDYIAANYDGVILKLTEGNNYVDPTFYGRYDEVTKRGLKVQSYHFARFQNDTDARLEAEFHLQKLGSRKVYNDEVNLDIETDDYKLSKAALTGCVIEFAKTVSRLKDYNTVVYSYPSFLKNELNNFNLPVWLADYSSDGHYTNELDDIYEIIMVQYTSKGRVTGVNGNVDMNHRFVTRKVPKPSTKPYGLIQKGEKGPGVKQLQKALLEVGCKLPKFGSDGDFGDETEEAVKSFQRSHHLTVDGIFGPQTRSELDKVLKAKQVLKKAVVPYPGYILKKGSKGLEVKRVQHALNLAQTGDKNLVEDGIFGNVTEKAVENYQKRKHLDVDGVVGPDTWNTLF